MPADRSLESVEFEAKYLQQINNDLHKVFGLTADAAGLIGPDVASAAINLAVATSAAKSMTVGEAQKELEVISQACNGTTRLLKQINDVVAGLGELLDGRIAALFAEAGIPPMETEGE